MEASAATRPAVGVDRDGSGRLRGVADAGPPGDARAPAGVVLSVDAAIGADPAAAGWFGWVVRLGADLGR